MSLMLSLWGLAASAGESHSPSEGVTVVVSAAVAQNVQHPHVAASTTYFFAALLALMVLTLALEEKLHAKKSLITGIFAAVALFAGVGFGILPGEVWSGRF